MEIKDGFMDTLHNKSFDILINSKNFPFKSFEKRHLNNINNCSGKNGEEIIGCLVGSLVDISSCKTEQVESFIRNPRRHTRMMYIMTLGTILKYRHCGLATKLANICIQLAENIPSCGAIYLHVITDNNKAIRLYEKLGF